MELGKIMSIKGNKNKEEEKRERWKEKERIDCLD